MDRVLSRCGDPSRRQVYVLRNRHTITELQVWIYDLGPSTFLRYLRFYNGTLEQAEEHSR
jgi:hypothetical protein